MNNIKCNFSKNSMRQNSYSEKVMKTYETARKCKNRNGMGILDLQLLKIW